MATIRQINKQIETSKKRIADFERRITMYQERRDKNIATANKKFGTDIKVVDIISKECGNARYRWLEYHMPDNIREIIGFETSFKITDAYNSMEENMKNLRIEQKNLERLQAELSELEARLQDAANKYNTGLDAALRSAMAGFKTVWFDYMITWYGKHFDFIKEHTPENKERRTRINILLSYFGAYFRQRAHLRISRSLARQFDGCNSIINDEANRFDSREAYLEEMRRRLELSWENGIVKLTEKCQRFGVDENNVTTSYPGVTSKGFEVIIRDGKPRMIHARVIWAAVDSNLVEPHTRYIVTERTNK